MGPVAVCVCTWERPKQLARLLTILAELPRPAGTIFVVVNSGGHDPQTDALVTKFRETCASRVEYVAETSPGISAARNAALAEARAAGATAVAMLDDDEWPSRAWLTSLVETQLVTGAGVVGGPVQAVFASRPERLRKYENLWSVQRGLLNGQLHVYCTCNCLFKICAADVLGTAPFPEEFGLTGGEDVVFFRRLHFAGVPMAWSDEAVVFEDVPEERASFAWMRRRWYRYGNAGVQCEKAAPDPKGPSPLLKTIVLCGRLPLYPLFKRGALRAPLLWILECERICGRVASHFGKVRVNYGRSGSASDTAPASASSARE
ncbi:MAG: glycosyltransferase family 2 protein [Rhizomicrobium sp.]